MQKKTIIIISCLAAISIGFIFLTSFSPATKNPITETMHSISSFITGSFTSAQEINDTSICSNCTTKIDLMPDVLRSKGTYDSNIVQVPENTTWIGLAIERKNFEALKNGKTLMDAAVEISRDDGKTWEYLGSVGTDAGESVYRNGTPRTETTFEVRLPRDLLASKIPLLARAVLNTEGKTEGYVKMTFNNQTVAPLPDQTHHSVTYDTDSQTHGTSATYLQFAVNVGNNDNRYLIGGGTAWDNTAHSVDSATYNSQSMTRIDHDEWAVGGTNGYVQGGVFGITAPTVGNNNFRVTFSGTTDETGASAMSVYNVDQTSPNGTPLHTHSASTDPSLNLATSSGDMGYDILYYYAQSSPSYSAGANQVMIANELHCTNCGYTLASYEPSTGTTTTMSWTLHTGGSTQKMSLAVPILQLSAPSDTTPPQFQTDNKTNTTLAGYGANFSITTTDETALKTYVFSWVNGGTTLTFANDSAVTISGTSRSVNVTKTLNSTVGVVIRWMVYAIDAAGNQNKSGIFNYTTTDIIPPQWIQNNTNSTLAGNATRFNLNWTDETQLSSYIFSFVNGSTTFSPVNDSAVKMVGTKNSTNVTKIVNTTVGEVIRWGVYANDSSDNWNFTGWFNFTTTVYSTGGDPCIYSGSGDYLPPCDCVITSPIDVGGNDVIIAPLQGSNEFVGITYVDNYVYLKMADGCVVK